MCRRRAPSVALVELVTATSRLRQTGAPAEQWARQRTEAASGMDEVAARFHVHVHVHVHKHDTRMSMQVCMHA